MDPKKAKDLLREFPFLAQWSCCPDPYIDSRDLIKGYQDIRVAKLDSDVLARTTWWNSGDEEGWFQRRGAKFGRRFYCLVMRGEFYRAIHEPGRGIIVREVPEEFAVYPLSEYSSSGKRPLIESLGALIRDYGRGSIEFRQAKPVALLEYTGGHHDLYRLVIYKCSDLQGFEELVEAAEVSIQEEPVLTCDPNTRLWPPHQRQNNQQT